jgi:hypothetical protein
MEDQAYLGELVSAVLYLIAGARLWRLSRRTGELPERLLGIMFLFVGTSYVLYNLPIIFDLESLWTPLNFAGRIVYLPAPVLLALFTRRVFRQDDAWGAWLVYGVAVLIVIGVTGSVSTGDWEGFSISNAWFWLEWAGYIIPFLWAASEAFAQYGKARRRLRMGLTTPLVCNRLLLWGLFAALDACVWLLVLPQYAQYDQQNLFSETWDTLIGVLEITAIAMIWLTFFPPAYYRRWIGGAKAVVAEESRAVGAQ